MRKNVRSFLGSLSVVTFGMASALGLFSPPTAHAISIVNLGARVGEVSASAGPLGGVSDDRTNSSLGQFTDSLSVTSGQSFGGDSSISFDSDRTATQIALSASTFEASIGEGGPTSQSRQANSDFTLFDFRFDHIVERRLDRLGDRRRCGFHDLELDVGAEHVLELT